jgi:tetratricopeptide (TPR) repeat protein
MNRFISLPTCEPTPVPSQEGSGLANAHCQFPSWEGSGVGSFVKAEQRRLTLLFACLFLAMPVCFAASPLPEVSSTFNSANKLYEQGKFADAAGAYEKLIEAGSVSPVLYFNLGNALFKSGHIGRAIDAYRQAEQLAPRDPDLRANLQFARNQVQGPTFRTGRWEHWLGTLSMNEWTWASAAAIWLTFLLLAAMQLRRGMKRALRSWTAFAGGTAVLLSACLGCALAHRLSVNTAIVTADELTARTGPFDESQSAFTAHDGAEFRVLDGKDDWFQVSDGSGRIGWLRRSDVVMTKRT